MTHLVPRLAIAWLAVAVLPQHTVRLKGKPATPQELQAQIEALRVLNVAWRQIAWKSCLLEGLRESREQQKPVLLWIFIDRPADDARC